jgi:sugar phosphate isomerase/epimerase
VKGADRKMKISLHSVSYSGTITPDQVALPLQEVMAKAKWLGFDGVTLAAKRPHALPLDLSSEDREAIKQLASSLGLEIVCVAGYNDFADPSAFKRQINLAYVIECIELASDVGAPVVRTFASGMGASHGAPITRQIEWVIEMAEEAAKVAEGMGVTLVIQNHSPIGNNIDSLRQIVEAVGSPAYKAAVDCPLLTGSGVDYVEALEACKAMMGFTTAGDHRSGPGPFHLLPDGSRVPTQVTVGAPLGQGDCDWPRFLRALKATGYDYWINYEMCSRMPGGGSEENLDRIASTSINYLRPLIDEIYGAD